MPHVIIKETAMSYQVNGPYSKTRGGTWSRTLSSGCRAGCQVAMSKDECEDRGLTPGPGNHPRALTGTELVIRAEKRIALQDH